MEGRLEVKKDKGKETKPEGEIGFRELQCRNRMYE